MGKLLISKKINAVGILFFLLYLGIASYTVLDVAADSSKICSESNICDGSYIDEIDIEINLSPLYTYKELAVETDIEICSTIDEAGYILREHMENREETIEFIYNTDDALTADVLDEIVSVAFEHTGVPTEGDYLKYQYGSLSANAYITGNTCNITFEVTYYTSYEQEQEVDQAIGKVLSNLSLENKADLQKIKAVYDYICKNVTYDYTNLEDSNYKLKHTAYAALIEDTAVCQGYAVLLYRLLLELDVDNRIIGGVSFDENHAWNIVKSEGKYYNLDSTWDAGKNSYDYFLKCNTNFVDHSRSNEFDTDEFNSKYVMHESDYIGRQELSNEGYEYVLEYGEICITKYIGDDTDVVVPSEIDGYMVKEIASLTFYNNELIKSIVLSEGIETINNEWVYGCEELESVHFSSTIGETTEGLHMAGLTFFPSNCDNIHSITVDENNPKLVVQDGVVYSKDMSVLCYYPPADTRESFIVYDGVTSIFNSAFRDNPFIKELYMPDTVTEIGYWAFSGATNLETINISNNCQFIGQYAFHKTSIKELYIPATVNYIMTKGSALPELERIVVDSENDIYYSIDGVLFRDGTLLYYPRNKSDIEYSIPNGIEIIEDRAFEYCNNLFKVDIPDSVTYIGNRAFVTAYLGIITIPNSDIEFGNKFVVSGTIIRGESGSKIEEYALENNLSFKSINGKNFDGICGDNLTWTLDDTGLLNISGTGDMYDYESYENTPWYKTKNAVRKINISEGVTNIGKNAFKYCSNLLYIDLPTTLIDIGERAFDACNRLEEILIPEMVSKIRSYTFSSCNNLKKIVLHQKINKIETNAFLNCINLVIHGNIGSYAQKYASNNDIRFVKLMCDIHSVTVIEELQPTCTKNGLTEGSYCSICHEVLVAQEEVPAFGHTEVVDLAVEPVLCTPGLTEGKHCLVCNEVLVAQEEIPALGHVEIIDDAVGPTCTETGLTEGMHCSACNEVLVAQKIVKALGHTEVIVPVLEPTETETGLTEGKYCSVCGEVLVPQEVIPVMKVEIYYYGDISGDGTVNASDALAILKHAAKLETIEGELLSTLADINGDGNINASDALEALKMAARLTDVKEYHHVPDEKGQEVAFVNVDYLAEAIKSFDLFK